MKELMSLKNVSNSDKDVEAENDSFNGMKRNREAIENEFTTRSMHLAVNTCTD